MAATPPIRDLDLVVLLHDDPPLRVGDVGTVVLVHRDGEAFEVEFVSEAGATVAVATLGRDQVRPLDESEAVLSRAVAV